MNKSLSSFMVMAAVTIIITSLLFGVAFNALQSKNTKHQDALKSEHQIKIK